MVYSAPDGSGSFFRRGRRRGCRSGRWRGGFRGVFFALDPILAALAFHPLAELLSHNFTGNQYFAESCPRSRQFAVWRKWHLP